MEKEVKTQVKVGVGVEALWEALAKDLRYIVPKVVPNLVKDVQVVEGEGGLGTILLFNFVSDVPGMGYQKEKIVELDESLHRSGLQVIEGGHLNCGFSSYKTTFQLSEISGKETLIELNVAYESEVEAEAEGTATSKTTASALSLIKCLEIYLLNGASLISIRFLEKFQNTSLP